MVTSWRIFYHFCIFVCIFLERCGLWTLLDHVSYHILIRITSLHGYILSYWSICLWLQADIFYHFLHLIVFLLRIMWPGNIIIFHHNFYSWLVVFYVPLIARSFTVPWEGGEARFLHCSHRESNPGPSRGNPLHYRCATPAPHIIFISL